MTDTANQPGVIGFLLGQHAQVRDLLDRVTNSTGDQRKDAFDELREMLARHETAEEMVLRPITRTVPEGKEIAENRMAEENESKDQLAELEKLDVTTPEFEEHFKRFATAVREHADAEEREEFPALRDNVDARKLETAETALKAAEATAPTHPHPSARSTTMNYVAGPFASMLDRARDALSKVTGS